MKIQIVTNQTIQKTYFPNATICTLGKPQSLDEFDVVIIDLSAASIWRNKEPNPNSIDCINDFTSIKEMVRRTEHAVVLFVFPGNVEFKYSTGYSASRSILIKDHLGTITKILNNALPDGEYQNSYRLLYESTRTEIKSISYMADFYFDGSVCLCTKSVASNKPTTIKWTSSVYLTTLNILKTEHELRYFVDLIVPQRKKEDEPDWIKKVVCFDDEKQNETIIENQTAIRYAQKAIDNAKMKLAENSRFKSILYTNGAELVEVIFDILEKILDCDLSQFVDEKKEDFQIKKEGFTVIGEIKGVTSNIKNEHISQVDVHYQGYMDRLADAGLQENVHQVLIVNPFRNKPISEREPVHDTQIKLAERNGCLIIETMTLLRLYEQFSFGKLDVEFCEKLFTQKTGLLQEKDFGE